MDRVTLTESELLEALQAVLETPDSPDAFTMEELKRATGRTEYWLQARLRAAVARGDVQPVKVPRPNLWGDVRQEPAYRFKRAA